MNTNNYLACYYDEQLDLFLANTDRDVNNETPQSNNVDVTTTDTAENELESAFSKFQEYFPLNYTNLEIKSTATKIENTSLRSSSKVDRIDRNRRNHEENKENICPKKKQLGGSDKSAGLLTDNNVNYIGPELSNTRNGYDRIKELKKKTENSFHTDDDINNNYLTTGIERVKEKQTILPPNQKRTETVQLPDDKKAELRYEIETVQQLPNDKKAELRYEIETVQQLPDDKKAELRYEIETVQQLPNDKKAELRYEIETVQQLTNDKKAELRYEIETVQQLPNDKKAELHYEIETVQLSDDVNAELYHETVQLSEDDEKVEELYHHETGTTVKLPDDGKPTLYYEIETVRLPDDEKAAELYYETETVRLLPDDEKTELYYKTEEEETVRLLPDDEKTELDYEIETIRLPPHDDEKPTTSEKKQSKNLKKYLSSSRTDGRSKSLKYLKKFETLMIEEVLVGLKTNKTKDGQISMNRRGKGRPKGSKNKDKNIEKKISSANNRNLDIVGERKENQQQSSNNNNNNNNISTVLQCKICKKRYTSIVELFRHFLGNHLSAIGVYECGYCNIFIESIEDFVNHFGHHNFSQDTKLCLYFSCPLCKQQHSDDHSSSDDDDDDDDTKEKIRSKNRADDDDDTKEKIRSKNRADVFTRSTDFYIHLQKSHGLFKLPNNEDNNKGCKLCDDVVITGKQSFTEHVIDRHYNNTNDDRCPLCGKTGLLGDDCKLVDHLGEHYYDQWKSNREICPFCRMDCSAYDLTRHIIVEHVRVRLTEKPKFYRCYVCRNGFGTLNKLSQHVCPLLLTTTSTTDTNDVLCTECGARFPTKKRLTFHMQTHLWPNFAFQCDICWRRFDNDEDAFYNHTRFTHLADDNFICETCSATFKTRVGLLIHQQYHIGERKFACKICGKKFLNGSTLKEHEVCHMIVKPHMCHVCGICLSRPSRLRVHLRAHAVRSCRNTQTCFSCVRCGFVSPLLDDNLSTHVCLPAAADNESSFSPTTTNNESSSYFSYDDASFFSPPANNESYFPSSANNNESYLSSANNNESYLSSANNESYRSSANNESYISSANNESYISSANNESYVSSANNNDAKYKRVVLNKVLICEYCCNRFADRNLLYKHIEIIHPDSSDDRPRYSCNKCDASFVAFSRLSTHRLSHGINAESSILAEPISSTDTTTVAASERIAATTNNKINKFVIPQLFACKLCDKVYNQYTAFNAHRKYGRHKQKGKRSFDDYFRSNSPPPPETVVEKFTCDVCFKKFATKDTLKTHKIKFHPVGALVSFKTYFPAKSFFNTTSKCDGDDDDNSNSSNGSNSDDDNSDNGNSSNSSSNDNSSNSNVGTLPTLFDGGYYNHESVSAKMMLRCDICVQQFTTIDNLKTHTLECHPAVSTPIDFTSCDYYNSDSNAAFIENDDNLNMKFFKEKKDEINNGEPIDFTSCDYYNSDSSNRFIENDDNLNMKFFKDATIEMNENGHRNNEYFSKKRQILMSNRTNAHKMKKRTAFACTTHCGKQFPRKTAYDKHMKHVQLVNNDEQYQRNHVRDKSEKGDNKTRRRNSRQQSIVLHKCKECVETFASLKDYYAHIKRKHAIIRGGERFRCEFCQMLFSIRYDYERHKKTEHQLLLISCDETNTPTIRDCWWS